MKLFEFDMNLPTASTFVTYFVEFAVDETEYSSNHRSYDTFAEFKKSVQSEVMYFVDLSLFGNLISTNLFVLAKTNYAIHF